MNFAATGALDDDPGADTFINIDQCTDELISHIKARLDVSPDNMVSASELASIGTVPIAELSEYVNSDGKISLQDIVNFTIKRLAQGNARSIRAELRSIQSRRESAVRRSIEGITASLRRHSGTGVPLSSTQSKIGELQVPLQDSAQSALSFAGSEIRQLSNVMGTIGTTLNYQGPSLAAFNELKAKNQEQASQLSKADAKIAELNRLSIDKEFEITQLRGQIGELSANAAKPSVVTQQPSLDVFRTELQTIQASLRDSLLDIRGMIKDLHTAVVAMPSSTDTSAVTDESEFVSAEAKKRLPSDAISQQIKWILEAVSKTSDSQQTLIKKLDDSAATLLSGMSANIATLTDNVSSSQRDFTNILNEQLKAAQNSYLNTISARFEQLSTMITCKYGAGTAEKPTDDSEAGSLTHETLSTICMDFKAAIGATLREILELITTKIDTVYKIITQDVSTRAKDNVQLLNDISAKLFSIEEAKNSDLSTTLEENMLMKINTFLEQHLARSSAELAGELTSLRKALDETTTVIKGVATSANTSVPREAIVRIQQADLEDSRFLSYVAQAITFKTQHCLDQYFGLDIAPPAMSVQDENGIVRKPTDLVGSYVAELVAPIQSNGSITRQAGGQRSTFISCFIQAFIESLFPDLRAEIQETITSQLTVHMGTLAEEQLHLVSGLFHDFQDMIKAGSGTAQTTLKQGTNNMDVANMASTQQLGQSLAQSLLPHSQRDTTMICDDIDHSAMHDTARQLARPLKERAPVISGIISKTLKNVADMPAFGLDSEKLENSTMIVLNNEKDEVVDALIKEKELMNIWPGLGDTKPGPKGKRLADISLTAAADVTYAPGGNSMLEPFHLSKVPQHSLMALQGYLPDQTEKLHVIEDHILRQFADVRNSIEMLTKSINTSTYVTSNEMARMKQEYHDVAITIDDVNDGLTALIESESARTLSNLRHMVLADYITITVIFVLTCVLFCNLIVTLTHNCA